MERIDEIKAKGRSELTDEEFAYLVEWEAQARVRDAEFQNAEAQRQAAYDAIIDIEREKLNASLAVLEEMRQASRDRLERLEHE